MIHNVRVEITPRFASKSRREYGEAASLWEMVWNWVISRYEMDKLRFLFFLFFFQEEDLFSRRRGKGLMIFESFWISLENVKRSRISPFLEIERNWEELSIIDFLSPNVEKIYRVWFNRDSNIQTQYWLFVRISIRSWRFLDRAFQLFPMEWNKFIFIFTLGECYERIISYARKINS